mgnify:CR=1 FL=1
MLRNLSDPNWAIHESVWQQGSRPPLREEDSLTVMDIPVVTNSICGMDIDDNFDSHVQDTLLTASGLGNEKATKFMIENAPGAIKSLEDSGVEFTKNNNTYHLTTEGGHSSRRVAHVADRTGKSIQTHLLDNVKAKNNIKIFVSACYCLFVFFILILLFMMEISKSNLILAPLFILSLVYQIKIFNIEKPESCLKAFKNNNLVGFFIFIFILSFLIS